MYAVVVRNGVWIRTLAGMVRPTDRLARGTVVQGPLSHSALSGRVCAVGIDTYSGLYPGSTKKRNEVAATSLHLRGHTGGETQQIERTFVKGEDYR